MQEQKQEMALIQQKLIDKKNQDMQIQKVKDLADAARKLRD